jgi:MEMO1 family protein
MHRRSVRPRHPVALALVLLATVFPAAGCRTPATAAGDGAPVTPKPAPAGGPAARPEAAAPADGPKVVRPAAVAGSWYPGDAASLGREIDAMFARAAVAKQPGRKVAAVVSPHAGYRFSGQGAAAGYKLVQGRRYERVVLLGPSHHASYRGVAVTEATHYETPLGEIPVDRAACDQLLQSGAPFRTHPTAERREHSLEMQLPMLQRALGAFKLVPLTIGEMSGDDYSRAAAKLRELLGDGTLVVASSDFTHRGDNYGFEPFAALRGKPEALREKVRALDMGAVDAIRALDRGAFLSYLDRTGATVCGARPIALVVETLASRKPLDSELLSYYTSGDVLGDWGSSVSYVDLVLYGAGAYQAPAAAATPAPVPVPAPAGEGLTAGEKKTLLTLARRSLESAVRTGQSSSSLARDLAVTPRLRRDGGAFVTLKVRGELRGCIGTLAARRPLFEDVIENALNAALHDSRFSQVTASELAGIDVEVSVLTAPREVPRAEDFVVGKHGVILEKHGRRATFLPQVAPEQGWDRETTLAHLARKAGLPSDAWRSGTRFWVYEAIVFGEKEH